MLVALAVLLAGLVLAGGVTIVVVGRSGGADTVYAVPDVRAALTRNPSSWAGRTVSVRGTLVTTATTFCQSVSSGQPAGCQSRQWLTLAPDPPAWRRPRQVFVRGRTGRVLRIMFVTGHRFAQWPQGLVLVRGASPRWLDIVSRLPLVGPSLRGLIQPPHVYRVRLLVPRRCAISTPSCPDAVLLDA